MISLFKTTGFALALMLVGLLAVGPVSAASSTGMGVYQVEGKFKKKQIEEYRSKATELAIASAWDRYVISLPQPKQLSYSRISGEFTSDLSRFVQGVVVLDESHDKDRRVYEVMVRASINAAAVDATFNMHSAVQQSGGEGSLFTFMFLAREVEAVKSYEAKKTSITQVKEESSVSAEGNARGGSAAAASSSETFSKQVTGGSSVQKADKRSYRVTSPQDISASMGEILSMAGFEVIEYGDVVSECGGVEPTDIMAEFSQSDDMQRETRRSAIGAARDCEISYFSTGTIDVGMKDTDPVSGNQRVYVSVRGQVWDVTRRLPKKVASVGPVQFAGLGPDSVVAQRNALILAAQEAAQVLVDQMNAKGLY
jgi:hypothetical protein